MVLQKSNGSAKEDSLSDTGLVFWNYITHKEEILSRLKDIQRALEWEVVSVLDNNFVLIKQGDKKIMSLISDLDTTPNIIEDAENYLKSHPKET